MCSAVRSAGLPAARRRSTSRSTPSRREDKPGADPDAPVRHMHGGKPMAPDEYLRSLKEQTTDEQVSILDLVENREEEPPVEPSPKRNRLKRPKRWKRPNKISEDEQAELSEQMDENQKAPMRSMTIRPSTC